MVGAAPRGVALEVWVAALLVAVAQQRLDACAGAAAPAPAAKAQPLRAALAGIQAAAAPAAPAAVGLQRRAGRAEDALLRALVCLRPLHRRAAQPDGGASQPAHTTAFKQLELKHRSAGLLRQTW